MLVAVSSTPQVRTPPTVSKAVQVVKPEMPTAMLPVLLSPKVRVCFVVVANLPSAVRYAEPALPAETEATGVPELTFSTANFAEVVAFDPSSRSNFRLLGQGTMLHQLETTS